MRSWYVRYLLRLFLFMLPYTVFAVLGIVWVVQNRLSIPFACGVAIFSILGWLAIRWLDHRAKVAAASAPTLPAPSNTWPEAGEKAWAQVDAIARRVEHDPPPIQDVQAWQDLGFEVVQAAAQPFNSKSSHAYAAITLPDALQLGEIILRDMRTYIDENVPFVDTVKLDLIASALGAKKKYASGMPWGKIFGRTKTITTAMYWGTRTVMSPTKALASGVQQAAVGSGTTNLAAPLVGMIATRYVRTTGRYAIDLYSGQLKMNDSIRTEAASKPLQILLLGQTKAGKSSLVNTLFGKPRAATDILPCTDKITPYAIEKEGLPSIHLYDSVGFGGSDDNQALKLLQGKLSACDLVLVVCSATSAAREADRKLLDEARQKLTSTTRRALPPIIVALTHIDTIRPFSEWKPPYDFNVGESPKEKNVREACAVVAGDLQVPLGDVVPVCTHPDRPYNIEDGLTAKIIQELPDADRAKLLRILQESMSAAEWEKLKWQLANAGIKLVAAVAVIAAKQIGGPIGGTAMDSVAGIAKQYLQPSGKDSRLTKGDEIN